MTCNSSHALLHSFTCDRLCMLTAVGCLPTAFGSYGQADVNVLLRLAALHRSGPVRRENSGSERPSLKHIRLTKIGFCRFGSRGMTMTWEQQSRRIRRRWPKPIRRELALLLHCCTLFSCQLLPHLDSSFTYSHASGLIQHSLSEHPIAAQCQQSDAAWTGSYYSD